MSQWVSHNNPAKQTATAVGCAIVGLVMVIGFSNFPTAGRNALAGFLLGVLLLIIGVWRFLVRGKQTVVVDPATRLITVEDTTSFGTKRRSIRLADVDEVAIGYLGKKSNFVEWWYLLLKLKGGEEYSLFAPGRFYPGGSDRPTVETWRRRLQDHLGTRDDA